MNLPIEITMGTNSIKYVYNATGQKVKKTVVEGTVTTTTDYLDGFQYSTTTAVPTPALLLVMYQMC